MPSPYRLKLVVVLAGVILGVILIQSWRAERRDRAALNAELAATRQLLAAADARQHDRDAQLAQTLAAIAAEKRTVVTPTQILRELPKELPLPAPIVLQTSPTLSQQAAPESASQNPAAKKSVNNAKPAQTNAIIPAEDLKPLYDFALDCKACQAKLSVAQNDLLDERKKTAALARERDDALRVARGGSAWRRIGRAAKWFVIGAAAGAVAAKAR